MAGVAVKALLRRPKDLRRLLGVQAVAAVAQVSGAAQLAALLVVVGSGRSTDAYVTLFTASQLAGAIIVTGTLQPLALSDPNYSGLSRWAAIGAALNVIAVLATAVLLAALHYPTGDVTPTAVTIALSGTVAVVAGVLAVERALSGLPALLSGLTIVPNVLATLFLIAAPGRKVLWMCIGLLVGNLLTAAYAARTRPARQSSDLDRVGDEPAGNRPSRSDALGLAGSASVGALGPFGLQAAIASFPAGQATLLGFFSRIGAGLIGVGVTAYSYTTTDWSRRSVGPLRAMSRFATAAQGAAVAVAIGFVAWSGHDGWVAGALAAAWVLASASGATASRALGMEGNYRPFRLMALVSLVMYPLATWAIVIGPRTAASYFAALFVITATANLIFLRALDWRAEWRSALVGAALAVVLLVASVV